jgi:hypothetical protein
MMVGMDTPRISASSALVAAKFEQTLRAISIYRGEYRLGAPTFLRSGFGLAFLIGRIVERSSSDSKKGPVVKPGLLGLIAYRRRREPRARRGYIEGNHPMSE